MRSLKALPVNLPLGAYISDYKIRLKNKLHSMLFSLNCFKVFTASQIENEPTGANINLKCQLYLNLTCFCHRYTQPM